MKNPTTRHPNLTRTGSVTSEVQQRLRESGLLAEAHESWSNPTGTLTLSPRIAGHVRNNSVAAIGDTFGGWQVIERADDSDRGAHRFLCRCVNCDSEITVTAHWLRRGHNRPCFTCRARAAA